MQVSDLVNQYHNSLNAGSKIAKKTKGVEQLVKTVSSMEKGQVFEGTVQSVKGDKVTLALSSGQSVTARLDKNMDLSEGQSVFFQVKSNEGGLIQIRPVQSEFGGNPTLLNALKNAGLPENELNLKLVNAMMKEQMPIDKDSIKDMIRTLRTHPDANVETLVSMKKLDIPITDGMIKQFENYKQSEGAILKMVDDLADDIPKALSAENVTKEDVLAFQDELLDTIVSGEKEAEVFGMKMPQTVAEGSAGKAGEAAITVKDAAQNIVEGNNAPESDVSGTEKAAAKGSKEEGVPQSAREGDAGAQRSAETISMQSSQSKAEVSDLPKQAIVNTLSSEDLSKLTKLIDEHPDIAKSNPTMFDSEGILRPDTKGSEVLKAVNNYFAQNPEITKADVMKFLDSSPVKNILNSIMSDAWTMEPKELTKKGSIDKLYEKIEEDMQKIIETAKSTTHSHTNPVIDTAQGVKDNLSFIREVNQIYQYVQIPLQMSGEKTTGDLYVYTNKKQKRAENDEITAFLHFDMENLGSTDISVKLAGKKLDTKFFLEDDISFQIIQNNLHILEERLKDLGYNCNLEVENDSKQINFVEDFLKKDVKTAGDIHRYSFDVRA